MVYTYTLEGIVEFFNFSAVSLNSMGKTQVTAVHNGLENVVMFRVVFLNWLFEGSFTEGYWIFGGFLELQG